MAELQPQPYLDFAKGLAYEAGDIMREYFDPKAQRKQIKPDGSPVTIADLEINRLVIRRVAEQFPNDGVVGEEESTDVYGSDKHLWVCDPIDGTAAFTWGVPTAMFSLAMLVYGRPEIGVAYEPVTDRLYWAVRGHGAYVNGKPIRVNADSLATGTLAISSTMTDLYGNPYYQELYQRGVAMAPIYGTVFSAASIADGRLIGNITSSAKNHDIAAGQVIIDEAGGMITDLAGKPLDYTRPFKGFIISNGVVHDELLACVRQFQK